MQLRECFGKVSFSVAENGMMDFLQCDSLNPKPDCPVSPALPSSFTLRRIHYSNGWNTSTSIDLQFWYCLGEGTMGIGVLFEEFN